MTVVRLFDRAVVAFAGCESSAFFVFTTAGVFESSTDGVVACCCVVMFGLFVGKSCGIGVGLGSETGSVSPPEVVQADQPPSSALEL